MERSYDVCVLGNGLTARLLVSALMRCHVNVAWVSRSGRRDAGALAALLPIFAPTDSPVWDYIDRPATFPTLEISRCGDGGADLASRDFPLPSFPLQEQMQAVGLTTASDRWLAAKHNGIGALSRPVPLLADKVARKFGTPQRRSTMAFIDGVCPYDAAICRDRIESVRIDSHVDRLIPESKAIKAGGMKIRFNWVVSTLNFRRLLRATGQPNTYATFAADACIESFRTDKRLPRNELWYDARPTSPIYRCFSPSDHTLVVQRSRGHGVSNLQSMQDAIKSLIPGQPGLQLVSDGVVPNCYPLGIAEPAELETRLKELLEQRVVSFGRFARWQYRDIHELDWHGLMQTDWTATNRESPLAFAQ